MNAMQGFDPRPAGRMDADQTKSKMPGNVTGTMAPAQTFKMEGSDAPMPGGQTGAEAELFGKEMPTGCATR